MAELNSFHLKTYPNQDYLLDPIKVEGHYIFDKTGKKYIDLTAGGTSFNLLGSRNKKVHQGIINQLNKFEHLDCKTFSDDNREILSEILINTSNVFTSAPKKVFFSGGSGSEGIEMAMHLSYQFHKESGNNKKKWFLSRDQSYHGATSGALSLGERPNLEFYRPLQSQFRKRVSECNYVRKKQKNESEQSYTKRLVKEFEDTISEIGGENICAFVAETMMGGLVGDVPPTKDYWKSIKEVCAKNDIHLILDEVWCGTGSSGKYHCFEYDDIVPDFLVLGKTLGCGYIPISCVIVPAEFEEIVKTGTQRVEMSCTFQAHSLAIASAIEVQKIISKDTFIEDVFKKGEYIRKVLKDNLKDQNFVKDIRGRGIRNTVEYQCEDINDFCSQISYELFENYNILISSKWHRTSFSHAMNLSWKEIDFYLDAYLETLVSIYKKRKKNKNLIKQKRAYF